MQRNIEMRIVSSMNLFWGGVNDRVCAPPLDFGKKGEGGGANFLIRSLFFWKGNMLVPSTVEFMLVF